MRTGDKYDVIIIGGSFSGLAAAMALGRSMRRVLVIDSGKPCNRQTPHSHNFLTQDGRPPAEILDIARQQVSAYPTVQLYDSVAVKGYASAATFEIHCEDDTRFSARKLIFATGIDDRLPAIPGLAMCWGISVLHCPYCHGYEMRNAVTGIIGNGQYAFEFCQLISNWTEKLTLYTNGPSTLGDEQKVRLQKRNIPVVEETITGLAHDKGFVHSIMFEGRSPAPVKAVYTRAAFVQHCPIPEMLGCETDEEGYLKVDPNQHTGIPGIYACGDNSGRMRTVANAVASGTLAGMMVNRELIEEDF